jgi:cytochrome c oxidase cbb3-type subunit IV
MEPPFAAPSFAHPSALRPNASPAFSVNRPYSWETTMDINDIRAVLTVLGFLGFVGIVVWAYSRTAKQGFDEAEALPFADDESGRH